jgi:hypothetical protein
MQVLEDRQQQLRAATTHGTVAAKLTVLVALIPWLRTSLCPYSPYGPV